jgi:hypothetical protein
MTTVDRDDDLVGRRRGCEGKGCHSVELGPRHVQTSREETRDTIGQPRNLDGHRGEHTSDGREQHLQGLRAQGDDFVD